MEKSAKYFVFIFALFLVTARSWAAQENPPEDLKVISDSTELSAEKPEPLTKMASAFVDPIKYTLGPDDVIEISVMRHPEFSGVYPVNLEGKIQYKFVGDIEVSGLNKKELERKIQDAISSFVLSPAVTVTIIEYKSKVIYVLGEVGAPGKYIMRSDSIPVREAVVNAGLPTLAAAMRRCRIITPAKNNKAITKVVDLYSILYGGNLKENIDMHAGDVLYVPSTVMAKIVRVINPVTAAIGVSAAGPSDVNTGKQAVTTLAK